MVVAGSVYFLIKKGNEEVAIEASSLCRPNAKLSQGWTSRAKSCPAWELVN